MADFHPEASDHPGPLAQYRNVGVESPAHVVTREDAVAPPAPAPMRVAGDWHIGQRVRHSRYGSGTIVTIADDTIDCDFGKLGPRAFPRALCPLTAEAVAAH